MKCYRKLKPFKAISFDLDDTLYSNRPIMVATNKGMIRYFSALLMKHKAIVGDKTNLTLDHHFWWPFRNQVITEQPLLAHDVSELRVHSYQLGLSWLGFNTQQAHQLALEAMAEFNLLRSQFTVPEDIHQLLADLKVRWPLLAISNGNVDTQRIGLAPYFSGTYHSNAQQKQKPHDDMFKLACQQLGIAPHELLHVGDCGRNDVFGATNFGCQTVWLSCFDVGKPLSVLPNIELSNIVELRKLLY